MKKYLLTFEMPDNTKRTVTIASGNEPGAVFVGATIAPNIGGLLVSVDKSKTRSITKLVADGTTVLDKG